jgi:hypothetical protein
MSEIPEWRNVGSIMDTVVNTNVNNAISTVLATNHNAANVQALTTEASGTHCTTIKNIRYFDIQDAKYWCAMLISVLVFFLVEGILTHFQSDSIRGISYISFFMLTSYIYVIFAFLALIILFAFPDIIPNNYKEKALSLLVISFAVVVFFQHYILVCWSGFTDSPFISCLFFLALTILGLPREGGFKFKNNKAVNLLSISIISFILLLPLLSYIFGAEDRLSVSNDLKIFSEFLTFCTFVISALITIQLRLISSKKIKT